MDTKTDKHVTDLLAAFALNALDEDEIRDVSAHLETCAECYRELTAYQHVGDLLALSAPLAKAPSSLKFRLDARVRVVDPEPTLIHVRPWWKRVVAVPRPVIVALQV